MTDRIRPWQIVLFALAGASLVVGLWLSFSGDRLQLRSSVTMVDVATGELFTMKVGKGGPMVPGLNPKTRKMTLVRVAKKDGKWFIIDRDIPALNAVEGEATAVIDRETGEVRIRS
jgi:hypothetical protein